MKISNQSKALNIKAFALTFVLLFACSLAIAQNKTTKVLKKAATKTTPKSTLSFAIIAAEGNSFGYDILDNSRPLVHQPSKPGLPGNRGFSTKADAEKVAALVMYKIQHNQMPPTVTIHEMDSLKVKY